MPAGSDAADDRPRTISPRWLDLRGEDRRLADARAQGRLAGPPDQPPGRRHTARFPELATAIAKLRTPELVLDGEVAVFNETLVSQFHLLHDLNPGVVCAPPLFMAFDCLSLGRRDLRPNPLHERRRALEDVVDGADLVLPVRRLAANGLDAWKLVQQRRYEGLVAKHDASPYRTGASRAWVKIKFRQDARFLVGGVGETADRAPRLFVGERVARKLVYRGAVELGVGPRLVAELMSRGRRAGDVTVPGAALTPRDVARADRRGRDQLRTRHAGVAAGASVPGSRGGPPAQDADNMAQTGGSPRAPEFCFS